MKILFINLPYHGHVIPTIGFTQQLVKAGHQVIYLMPHDWESRLTDSCADFLGYENSPKLGSIPKNFVGRNHVPQITVLKQAMERSACLRSAG